MGQVQDRNSRCHCGSGKKFKNCHGGTGVASGRRIPGYYWLIGAAVAAVAAFVLLQKANEPKPMNGAPPGKVWSAEHNHWHDAP